MYHHSSKKKKKKERKTSVWWGKKEEFLIVLLSLCLTKYTILEELTVWHTAHYIAVFSYFIFYIQIRKMLYKIKNIFNDLCI